MTVEWSKNTRRPTGGNPPPPSSSGAPPPPSGVPPPQYGMPPPYYYPPHPYYPPPPPHYGRDPYYGRSRSNECYRCGRPGHFARECDRFSSGAVRRSSRSPDVVPGLDLLQDAVTPLANPSPVLLLPPDQSLVPHSVTRQSLQMPFKRDDKHTHKSHFLLNK